MRASSRGVVQGTVRAQYFLFEGQIVGLARTDEMEAGEAVLRLLGYEAGLAIGVGIGHGVLACYPLLPPIRAPCRQA